MFTVEDQKSIINIGRSDIDRTIKAINESEYYREARSKWAIDNNISEMLIDDIRDWTMVLDAPSLDVAMKLYWNLDTRSREKLIDVINAEYAERS